MPDLSTTTHDAFGLSIKNQFSTGDDQNNEEAVVKSAILNGQSTTFEEGRINIGSVNKGERVRLDVELQNSARMAYGV
jgi:hypothetical protein